MKTSITVIPEGAFQSEEPYPLLGGWPIFANACKSEIGVGKSNEGASRYAFAEGLRNACMGSGLWKVEVGVSGMPPFNCVIS